MNLYKLSRSRLARIAGTAPAIVFVPVAAAILTAASAQAELPVDGDWFEIGPPLGSIGGLAADPQEPELVIAANRSDWVFRSTDGGRTWSRGAPLSFGNKTNSLLADPHQAGVFYANTSISRSFLRSTDGGITWHDVNAATDSGVTALAADPGSSGVIYVGTSSSGLLRSADSGEALKRIDADSGFFSGVRIQEVVVDPLDPDRLFISTQGSEPGVVRASFDGAGWSFDSINSGLINPSSARLTSDGAGNLYGAFQAGGVFRFDPSNDEWGSLVHPDSARAIEAYPGNSGIVFTGGFDSIYRTTVGGGSGNWTQELDTDIGEAIEFAFADTPLLATQGFGVFKREAASDQPGTWSASNAGMNAAVVVSVMVDPLLPGRYLAGLQGPGLMETTDGGQTWKALDTGQDSDRALSHLQVSPFTDDRFFGALNRRSLLMSDDAGVSWIDLDPGGILDQNIDSVVLADDQTVYVASNSGVHRGNIADPSSVNWTAQHQGLPADFSSRDLGLDATSGQLYLLTRTEGVYRADVNGNSLTWKHVPHDGTGNLFFSNLLVDEAGRFAYSVTTTATGKIFRLDLDEEDGEFTEVNHNLPGTSLLILFKPGGDDRIVANTNDEGIFYSEDRGETWLPLGTTFPFRLFDLIQDVHNPDEYLAATNAASVVRLVHVEDVLFRDRFEGDE